MSISSSRMLYVTLSQNKLRCVCSYKWRNMPSNSPIYSVLTLAYILEHLFYSVCLQPHLKEVAVSQKIVLFHSQRDTATKPLKWKHFDNSGILIKACGFKWVVIRDDKRKGVVSAACRKFLQRAAGVQCIKVIDPSIHPGRTVHPSVSQCFFIRAVVNQRKFCSPEILPSLQPIHWLVDGEQNLLIISRLTKSATVYSAC